MHSGREGVGERSWELIEASLAASVIALLVPQSVGMQLMAGTSIFSVQDWRGVIGSRSVHRTLSFPGRLRIGGDSRMCVKEKELKNTLGDDERARASEGIQAGEVCGEDVASPSEKKTVWKISIHATYDAIIPRQVGTYVRWII